LPSESGIRAAGTRQYDGDCADRQLDKLDNTPLSVADLPKNLIALDLDDHLVSRVMDACEELGISFTSYTEVQTMCWRARWLNSARVLR
jgi:hypothetical protein